MTPAIRGLDLAVAMFASVTDSHQTEPHSQRFTRFLDTFDVGQAEQKLAEQDIRFVGRSDAEYPPLLAAIRNPPAGLFVRGSSDLSLLQKPSVAVVGSRSCSAYGGRVARHLTSTLADAGLVIVSGLARGIDAAAHTAALDAGGETVAVFGCGIDRIYPTSHKQIAGEILEAGLLVSEYAPGTPPAPWRFPARNRIVAGLCAATIVVEGRERSGSLITADFAMESGRQVFAVPGEITYEGALGSNGLLLHGATALLRAQQVLDAYGIEAEMNVRPDGPETAQGGLIGQEGY